MDPEVGLGRVGDDRLDVAVIGAGVIGLAIARALAQSGREVVVLEAEASIGTHTSSRNSEVIHSGIYYPTGSLKALLCVAGKRLLYEYCQTNEVAFASPGKIIVATGVDEIPALHRIKAQAEANGVDDLQWLDQAEVRSLEPALRCARGLFSPSTGIVDSHGLMAALRCDAEDLGARICLSAPVVSGQVQAEGIQLSVGGIEPTTVLCRSVVNAAGLRAPEFAQAIDGVPKATIPQGFFAKGQYFTLAGPAPFRHLVYPIPVPGGLGIHVTLDLAGQVRFGPDVLWVGGVDYRFDESRAPLFYSAIRSYYPALEDHRLVPGYVGVRPKLGPEGSPAHDFLIQGPADHGVPGLVNLYGIESPGLTASLAVARHVETLMGA